MPENPTSALRELDHRVSDGIAVWLLWRPQDDRALVAVRDAKTGESFTIEVAEGQKALEVFRHPYAYVGNRRAAEGHSGELALLIGS